MSGYLRAAFSTVLAAVILGWGTGVTVAAAPTVTLEDKQDKQDKKDKEEIKRIVLHRTQTDNR